MIRLCPICAVPVASSSASSLKPLGRLRIHTNTCSGRVGFPWLWLKVLWHACSPRAESAPVRLSVAEFAGVEVAAAERCDPLTVVSLSLPAGTYHVTVRSNAVRRRYTLTLEPGALFDLHVDLAPVRTLSVSY